MQGKDPLHLNITFSKAEWAVPYVVSEGNKQALPGDISCYPEIAVQNFEDESLSFAHYFSAADYSLNDYLSLDASLLDKEN